jgi:ubiquinone/menaquinone biosynthesis C-methylase UbiE
MKFYDRYIYPRCLDKVCGIGPITKQREKIVPLATGCVVEIGIGSGLNLPHYDPKAVTKIIGVDPDYHLWKRSEKRRGACPIEIERIGLSDEKLPLEDNIADTVLVSYTLCTIPDPIKALNEMARVLRPDGLILFAEHGKAPDVSVRKWQTKIDPLWKRIAGGRHSGRDIPALFETANLELTAPEQMYIPGPRVLSYNYWGAAKAK